MAIMIRPSERDGMAGDIFLIWAKRQQEYFLSKDLTGFAESPDG
jgi:hypothetical protein